MGKRRDSDIPVDPAIEDARVMASRVPLTLVDAMEMFFTENPSLGVGDLRADITLEALQRTEHQDHWTICGRKLDRASVMETILDLTARGYSIPAILQQPGMPKPRTYMAWCNDYKVFADMMAVAEQMRAIILAEQALNIVDLPDPDGSQTFKHKIQSDLRVRLAEIFNPKKYGKKQVIDINRHDDANPAEMWSRFISVLSVYKQMIFDKTGIKVIMPGESEDMVATADAEVVPEEEEMEALGMEGATDPTTPTNYDDMLTFDDLPKE
jgi:hypothetical protein